MGKLRQLCHWFTGQGKSIDVSDFVPPTHPLRQWSDVLPWSKFVEATEKSFTSRCARLRTDFAVMYACEIEHVKVDRSQAHYVLPESLCQFRRRIDETLMAPWVTIQASEAMEEGVVSPEHLMVDTFPSEQGSQRITDATTLYKAKKKSSTSPTHSPPLNCRRQPNQDRSSAPAKRTQKQS